MRNRINFSLALLITGLLSSSITSFAQKPKDIYLGVNLSLDHSTYTPPYGNYFIPGLNSIGNLQFSYTAGITTFFQRTDHLGIQAGINFKDALTKYSAPYYSGVELIPSPDMQNGTIRGTEHSRLLEFPFRAYLNLSKKKIKFIASAGLVTGIILNYYSLGDIIYNDGSTRQESYYWDKFSGNQRLYFNFIFSAGISYQLNEKYLLLIEPTDVIYINTSAIPFIFENTPFASYTHIFGLNVTVMRKM